MSFFVSNVIAFATAHSVLAYGLAFLLAAVEAFPVIGATVPGTAVIIGLGALVPGGALALWPLVGATAAGAATGDGLSYLFGRRYKQHAMTLWPLRARPGLLASGEAFFARHGSKAVLISRFLPAVRAVIPLVAGISGMSAIRFYAVDICAGGLFALSHILFGMAIGASLTVLHAIAGRLVILVLLLAVSAGLVVWLTPWAVRRAIALVARLRGPVRQWAEAGDSWYRRLVRSLLDPERPEALGLAVLAFALIGGLWLFLGVLQDIIAGDPLVRADRAVFHLLQSLRVPVVDQMMVAITELGDASVIVPVTLAVLAWLVWQRAWRAVIYGVAAVAGASIFAVLLKATLHQARPGALYQGWNAYSFPSSHSAASTALFGFLLVLICREVGARTRAAVTLAAVSLVSAIAFSRLYLGAHWLSDVLAGLAFGTAWAALLGIVYLQHTRRGMRAGGLAGISLAALLAAGSLHIAMAHATDMRRYAVLQRVEHMALTAWQNGGWAALPVRRVDLSGDYEEPFTIQWAGSLAALKAELLAQGWREPVPWTLRASLEWLLPNAAPDALPVLPHLDNGRPEALVMIRTGDGVPPDQRLILRLWPSGVVLTGNAAAQPVWIGTVAAEKVEHLKPLATIVDERQDVNAALEILKTALPAARLEDREPVRAGQDWNGMVIVGQS
ncbi:MAG: LssY C-terminal domain-containing protein [Acidocella sp.]|nr:LssY C-terminal domain-containing protein [Acidocella sp.]